MVELEVLLNQVRSTGWLDADLVESVEAAVQSGSRSAEEALMDAGLSVQQVRSVMASMKPREKPRTPTAPLNPAPNLPPPQPSAPAPSEPAPSAQPPPPPPKAAPPVTGEPSVDDLVGRLLDVTARFQVQGEIARGAMGRILAAWDLHLGRPVALKVLSKPKVKDIDRVRFLEEAQVTGQLQHPSIMPVYEIGRLAGQVTFVMPRIEGRSLKQIFKALKRGDDETIRAFRRTQLLTVFLQICQAMAFAHTKGVVHRDLKPGNVMVGDFGQVVVIDWGLCKIMEGGGARSTRSASERWQTVAGQIIGTPAYMAPEQAMGLIDEVDERTDVYGLGAILYNMLSLEAPYSGASTRGILAKVIREPVQPVQDRSPERRIPNDLATLCMRCLRRDPSERYPNAQALAAAVEGYLERVEGATPATSRAGVPSIRPAPIAPEGMPIVSAAPAAMPPTDASRSVTNVGVWLERAEAAAHTHEQRLEDAAMARDTLRGALSTVTAQDGATRKRPAWMAEDEVYRFEAEAEVARATALEALSRVLGADPTNTKARRRLCDLHIAEIQDARRIGDRRRLAAAQAMLALHDDGKHGDHIAAEGALKAQISPKEARIKLCRLMPRDRRLVPLSPQPIGLGTAEISPIAAGSYQIMAESPGHEPLTVPIEIVAGRTAHISVSQIPHGQMPLGFCHVPAGTFRAGGGVDLTSAPAEHAIGDFLISTTPITAGEYMEFISALNDRRPQAAERRVPRSHDGRHLAWRRDENGRWRLPDHTDPIGAWPPDMPMVGICADDALAYCEWRTIRDGVRVRLPTELEWEKAARGVDGRAFPWGHEWEPSYAAGPAVVSGPWPLPAGRVPQDISPYGVRDTAGGVREWTATMELGAELLYVVRGGSFLTAGPTRPLYFREAVAASRTAPDLGFRILIER